jgi:hypothetical protein
VDFIGSKTVAISVLSMIYIWLYYQQLCFVSIFRWHPHVSFDVSLFLQLYLLSQNGALDIPFDFSFPDNFDLRSFFMRIDSLHLRSFCYFSLCILRQWSVDSRFSRQTQLKTSNAFHIHKAYAYKFIHLEVPYHRYGHHQIIYCCSLGIFII